MAHVRAQSVTAPLAPKNPYERHLSSPTVSRGGHKLEQLVELPGLQRLRPVGLPAFQKDPTRVYSL